MPVKQVVCGECGKTVSKRSTLDLGPLGGNPGIRVCRSHKIVKQLRRSQRIQAIQEAVLNFFKRIYSNWILNNLSRIRKAIEIFSEYRKSKHD